MQRQPTGYVPLYVRIREQLREEILAAKERDGHFQLPPERELEARYQVSRPTISKALTMLAAEGLLVKEQGRGTFVRPRAPEAVRTLTSSKRISCIAPLTAAPVIQRFLYGVDRAAHARGYSVLISNVGRWDVQRERVLFAELVQAGVAGMILYPVVRRAHEVEEDYLRHEFLDVPTVLAGPCAPTQGRAQVVFNNVQLGYDVTRWLLRHKHRHIGLLTVSPDWVHPSLRARREGYHRALKEARITPKPEWVQCVDFAEPDVREALDVWCHGDLPTAIIAVEDIVAMRLIEELEQRGIHVPEQVTVFGFDNRPEALHFHPPFPTTNPDFVRMGEQAVRTLVDALETGAMPTGCTTLPVPLHIRRAERRSTVPALR